jgi:hypothetical protein
MSLAYVHFYFASKGSVIATVKISGLKTPTSTESDLTRELEAAIQGKKLGDLTISEPDTTTKPPGKKLNLYCHR